MLCSIDPLPFHFCKRRFNLVLMFDHRRIHFREALSKFVVAVYVVFRMSMICKLNSRYHSHNNVSLSKLC